MAFAVGEGEQDLEGHRGERQQGVGAEAVHGCAVRLYAQGT